MKAALMKAINKLESMGGEIEEAEAGLVVTRTTFEVTDAGGCTVGKSGAPVEDGR